MVLTATALAAIKLNSIDESLLKKDKGYRRPNRERGFLIRASTELLDSQAVGRCIIAPPVYNRSPVWSTLLLGPRVRPVSLVPGLGDALGVVGVKKTVSTFK